MADEKQLKPQMTQVVERHYDRAIAGFRNQGYEVKLNGNGRWIIVTHRDGLRAFLKVYDEPSKWGIYGGCISKLEIHSDRTWLYNYDRVLDFNDLDQHPAAQDFFKTIVDIAS